jgi:hypothetical protein
MSHTEDALSGDGRNETANERADRNWTEILQELRVTQTGIQLISGFLLAVAFQSRFEDLDAYQLALYLILVAVAACATLLGLAPVAMHRAHFGRRLKATVVQYGDRFLIANAVVVSVLTAGVGCLIFDFTLGRVAGWIALGAVFLFAAVLWFLIRPRAEARAAARAGGDAGNAEAPGPGGSGA